MRLIDAEPLYEEISELEDMARDRVIDTPSSFSNGMFNPASVRYMAQLSERTMFKHMVFDAPTIEERKTGKWIVHYECPKCGEITKDFTEYCPFCGADMIGKDTESV